MRAALRLGRLALVTCLVAGGTFGALAATSAPTAAAAPSRAAPAARGQSLAQAQVVRVSVDGLTARFSASGTVDALLADLGLPPRGSDRTSAPLDSFLLAGEHLAFDRGVPVTLVDGGTPTAVRSPRGTVAELLGTAQVMLGPEDFVEPGLDQILAAGATVRVTRVADREETLREPSPYTIRLITDPSLDRGHEGIEIYTYRGHLNIVLHLE